MTLFYEKEYTYMHAICHSPTSRIHDLSHYGDTIDTQRSRVRQESSKTVSADGNNSLVKYNFYIETAQNWHIDNKNLFVC